MITNARRDPIHPGEHLRQELETLQMSAAELSRQLGVPTNQVTAILNGRRSIPGDTALRLAHFLGTTPDRRDRARSRRLLA